MQKLQRGRFQFIIKRIFLLLNNFNKKYLFVTPSLALLPERLCRNRIKGEKILKNGTDRRVRKL
jgi:hypothetical protein